jgi:hypothetical protein
VFRNIFRPFYYFFKFIYLKYSPLKFNSFDKYWINQLNEEIVLDNFNFCIFISSKNNYLMFEDLVMKNYKIKNLDIYNIDDNSNFTQKDIGKRICNLNEITFIENQSVGLQMALKTLMTYLDKKNKKYKFILYISHDNYPVSREFFYKFNNFIELNNLDQIGCVGFNHLDYVQNKKEILEFKQNKFSIGLLGRSFLTSLNNTLIPTWYSNKSTNNFKNFKLPKPFAVEGIADMAFGINFNNLKKHIVFSNQYRLHCWADDICMQFLEANIYNLVIPNFVFFNSTEIKPKYSIHFSSVYSASKNSKIFELHKLYWKNKWKWDRGNLPTKEIVNKFYKNSLVQKFCEHDIDKGPVKYFDFEL